MTAGRILALEDNPERVAGLKVALESPGHHVTAIPEFHRAFEYLRQNHVDLIVCDVHLESASGFDFLRALKRDPQLSHIAFIFYCIEPSLWTKTMVGGMAFAAEALGAAEVIVMDDFDAGRLCHAIERHLPAKIERKCA